MLLNASLILGFDFTISIIGALISSRMLSIKKYDNIVASKTIKKTEIILYLSSSMCSQKVILFDIFFIFYLSRKTFDMEKS